MNQRIDEDITFRKLEIFLSFMETGSLARAAEHLGVSPVSVHRALHSLEAGTRCSLFRLEGRNLQPTEAAQTLAEAAREVLRTMADGIRLTREVAGYAADTIRIGSLFSLTSGTVPTLIIGLQKRRPDLQAELILGSNTDLLRKLRDGVVDAAIMGIPAEAGDIETQVLFEDDIYFAAPACSAYADQVEIDLTRCSGQEFVSLSEGFITYTGFVEAFRLAGFEPKVVMTTGDIFSLMNLVGGGIGCTLLPGRVRGVLPPTVRLIPLTQGSRMRQKIGACFLRARERDPNLLALLAVCRGTTVRTG